MKTENTTLVSLGVGVSQWVLITDPSLKGPSLLDHGQGGFRIETKKKTKRIIGDRAENSKASCSSSAVSSTFEITRDTHFTWGHTGDGHAAKVARG